MKKYIFGALLLLLCACGNRGSEKMENIEIIPVNVNCISTSSSSFIAKIEIVPLETNEASLLKSYQKMMYIKELDLYAILDNQFIVYLFSGDGKFVASSEKVRGDGPGQYQLIVDMKFNPYLKTIDLLNPYGTIYSYDKMFNLLALRNLEQKEDVFHYFMATSKNEYVLVPPSSRDGGDVYFMDFSRKKTEEVAHYNTTLSTINMDRETFYNINDKNYFIPNGINYYCYQIDVAQQKLIPIMKLDFGAEEIKESSLPGIAKKNANEKELSLALDQMAERNRFLEESGHYLPLIKFFNDDFVYVHFIKHRKPGNFVYNRNTGKSFLQRGDTPLKMPFSFAIQDNVLLSITDPNEMSQYVNNEFMSEEEQEKIKYLKEDDNPIILKYYLVK